MKIVKVPFGKLILQVLPDSIEDIDATMTAHDILTLLIEAEETDFLASTLEQFLLFDENRRIRQIIRWAFACALVCSTAMIFVIIFISIVRQEFPGWEISSIPLLVPALVMWNQVGVLKAEKAQKVANIIGSVAPEPVKKVINAVVAGTKSTSTSSTTTTTSTTTQTSPPPVTPQNTSSVTSNPPPKSPSSNGNPFK